MSQKYDAFVHALKALCEEHEVQLALSGYDNLQVWDMKPGDAPIYQQYVEDCTCTPRNAGA